MEYSEDSEDSFFRRSRLLKWLKETPTGYIHSCIRHQLADAIGNISLPDDPKKSQSIINKIQEVLRIHPKVLPHVPENIRKACIALFLLDVKNNPILVPGFTHEGLIKPDLEKLLKDNNLRWSISPHPIYHQHLIVEAPSSPELMKILDEIGVTIVPLPPLPYD